MALPNIQVPFKTYKGTRLFWPCEVDEIQEMEIRDDDVWVLSFPRSGTTLTQEIVYLIHTSLDFDEAKATPLDERFPFLDLCHPEMPLFRGLKGVTEMTSPRLIKSHLHYHVLPPQLFKSKCKKIYIMRNPKDVFVSCLMLFRFMQQLEPDFTDQQYFDEWIDGETYASPWWQHVRDFRTNKSNDILVLHYENVVQDMATATRRIAHHLDVKLNEDQVKRIVDHCQFRNMVTNPSVQAKWMENYRTVDARFGGQIRTGKIGGWKNHLTVAMSERMDKMMAEKLGDLKDLKFDFGENIPFNIYKIETYDAICS